MNAEALEKTFLETLERLSWDRELVAAAAADQIAALPDDTELKDKEAGLNDRLRDIEQKIKNVLAAVEDGLAGRSVQARLQELERQRAVLQSEIARIRLDLDQAKPEPIDIKDAMSAFKECSELLQEMSLDEKEKLVDAILKSATVDKDKAVEFEFYVGGGTSNVVQNVKVGSGVRIRT